MWCWPRYPYYGCSDEAIDEVLLPMGAWGQAEAGL